MRGLNDRCQRASAARLARRSGAAGFQRSRNLPTRCSATPPSASPSSSPSPYPYNSGDNDGGEGGAHGRGKATLEHLGHAGVDMLTPSSSRSVKPWDMGWQVNERNLVWNDDLKLRLIKHIASKELGVSEQEMEARLATLATLLPGLAERLQRAPPALVARLAANPQQVAARLLALKLAFPTANLSVMVGNRLGLLTDTEDELGDIGASAVRLRQLLPGVNVDAFVADFPVVLDVNSLARALEDAARLLPDTDPVTLLRASPNIVLSLIKGKHLIEYDQVANPWT